MVRWNSVGQRRLCRRTLVFAATALSMGSLLTSIPASVAAGGKGLVLAIDLERRLSGGTWSLTVPRETGGRVGLRLLDAGTIPANGSVAISVPDLGKEPFAPGRTTFLHVSASKRVPDSETAWVTSASAGLIGSEVAAGGIRRLGAVAPELVDIKLGKADSVPVPLDQQRRADPSPDPPRIEVPQPAQAPVRRSSGLRAVKPSTRASAAVDARAPTVRPDAAGQGMVPQLTIPVGCNFYGVCERVVASKLFPGVPAFRWFSSQGLGTTATFEVESAFQQEWQNGVRVGGKNEAFKIEGGLTRTKQVSGGIVDTWPTRPDCWHPDQKNDGPNCGTDQFTGFGFVPAYGRDTWQWQKVDVTVSCPDCMPYTYTEERLRNYGYDGGTEWRARQVAGFNARPSEVRKSNWGRFAIEKPGAGVKIYGETAVTEEKSALVSLEFSAAEGAFNASFTSTSKQKKTEKVNDVIKVRDQGDLPFLGDRLRYDARQERWKYVYWTCENATGYTGGECWDSGS